MVVFVLVVLCGYVYGHWLHQIELQRRSVLEH